MCLLRNVFEGKKDNRGRKVKVILEAFQKKLTSEPMEFPEETSPVIHLMLDLPKFTGFDSSGVFNPDIAETITKRGTFEYVGSNYLLSDNKTFARRYVLTGIS